MTPLDRLNDACRPILPHVVVVAAVVLIAMWAALLVEMVL